jgi:hypothetical protein
MMGDVNDVTSGGKNKVQKKGTRFVADWKDAHGRRHRKTFSREVDARRFEQRMIATSKMAFEMGERIGRGISKRGPARAREVRLLVDQCAKIAIMAALKKPATSEQLNQALSA